MLADERRASEIQQQGYGAMAGIAGRYKSKPSQWTTRRAIPGDLQRATPWLWLYCERCHHHSPLACAVVVIRWGARVSSDALRERARCMACGNKGATLQRPSREDEQVGFGHSRIGIFPDLRVPHGDVPGTHHRTGWRPLGGLWLRHGTAASGLAGGA